MAYTNIDLPTDYFNTVLYTGDDATNRSITGVGFQPDFTWIKSRSNAFFHELYDVVRGFSSTTNGRVLYSNATSAEGTPNTFNSFNTDGFTVSKQSGETGTNGNGATFVAWNWLANGAGVSNTAGTITSTVSANPTAGFSIVSYTAINANATVGHGLGVKPDVLIVKQRSASGQGWITLFSSFAATQFIRINEADALATSVDGTGAWNSTAPTSSVFSIGTAVGTGGSTATMIAYCFAAIKGYSKFGSYTGNGSTDGTFVYTGFKPAFVMVKSTSAAGTWCMLDNKRSSFNEANKIINAEDSAAEFTAAGIDFTSNGFKHRNSNTNRNASGVDYIYMAFAQNPFVTSGGIPVTAR
jgi:hypothetical protein